MTRRLCVGMVFSLALTGAFGDEATFPPFMDPHWTETYGQMENPRPTVERFTSGAWSVACGSVPEGRWSRPGCYVFVASWLNPKHGFFFEVGSNLFMGASGAVLWPAQLWVTDDLSLPVDSKIGFAFGDKVFENAEEKDSGFSIEERRPFNSSAVNGSRFLLTPSPNQANAGELDLFLAPCQTKMVAFIKIPETGVVHAIPFRLNGIYDVVEFIRAHGYGLRFGNSGTREDCPQSDIEG